MEYVEEQGEGKAWVIAIDMGYGHQRTAYPLRHLALDGRVLNANNYEGIPPRDLRFWNGTRSFYEFISRFRRIPFIGDKVFLAFDSFQKIMGYYPKRDLSKSNISGKATFRLIERSWGKDLIVRLKDRPLPIVSTFFTPAFMAEELKYPNEIFCVICDADIARAWVPLNPKRSRIRYLAPCTWARDRLKLYGVKPEHIILTGYPLPKENLGGPHLATLKHDLRYRLLNLDPMGRYRKLYAPLIKGTLGPLPHLPNHPLTVMFSIGGAGAQKEIALAAINGLKAQIKNRQLRMIISVGVRNELRQYFAQNLKDLELDGWVHILSGRTMAEYFDEFNRQLRTTDILWTKPSELSFYAALGIPIIIAPTLGSQEDFNRRWLQHVGAGMVQDNPRYAGQWIADYLASGDFAEMAMQGFVEMEKLGTYRIEQILGAKQFSFHMPTAKNVLAEKVNA